MKYLKIYTNQPEMIPDYLKEALTDVGLLMVDLDPFDVLVQMIPFEKMEVIENGVVIETFS